MFSCPLHFQCKLSTTKKLSPSSSSSSSSSSMAAIDFPDKLLYTAAHRRIIGSTRHITLLLSFAVALMLLLCSLDKSTIKTLLQPYPQQSTIKTLLQPYPQQSTPFTPLLHIPTLPNSSDWVAVDLHPNYTDDLYSHWTEPGGTPCRDSQTHDIQIPRFDHSPDPISLQTGLPHEIYFQSLDDNSTSRCLGGDFFELDLSGDNWKSRPPIKDYGNGTYSFTLQVHPDFSGEFNFTIILLFRHLQGLKYSPSRFFIDKHLRKRSILFTVPGPELARLPSCKLSDFNRTLWAGRWTRHDHNDTCEISDDGRYYCLPENYQCPEPWCSGPIGSLESNGWVYSAHCGFKLFSQKEAWECLNNKWLFWWGDSNHVDTVRNLLFFFLGVPDLEVVTRRFDKTFTNPRNGSERVRITNIFNGHWDDKGNYEGLNSLSNDTYRDMLREYFESGSGPDVVVFNSGLHDGVKWKNLRRFVAAAEFAAEVWAGIVASAEVKPRFLFRSTVATGGYARGLAFNPNKIEAFNGVLLDKLRRKGVVDGVVDSFDMTWAWHFDNRCNDGVHYGRFPAKRKWRDGGIGHQYFVDLMLGHVLLNAICAS